MRVHRYKLLLLIILSAQVCSSGATTFTLASNGKAGYNLMYPAGANKTEKFAADELRRYLLKISGASFKYSDKQDHHAIIVCTTDHLNEIVTNLPVPVLDKKDYGIFSADDNIMLIGGSDETILYAVYDFLSRLGCRWIAPDFECYGSKSHFIPEKQELEYIHQENIIERPVMRYRKLYVEEGRSHNSANLIKLIDWMPKNRFNILVAPIDYQGHGKVRWDNWREELIPELEKRGITIEVGGHGYQNFLNADMENGQLFSMHPEWFGMDSKGQRSSAERMVFCTSNEQAIAYLQKNILTYLQSHPEIDIFDFWPPDSELWCECADCRSMGTSTERHALLVSRMASFLRSEYPKVRLECLAYSRYVEPPTNEKINGSVLLDFCPIRQSFEYQIYDKGSTNNENYVQNLTDWIKTFHGDISIYSYYRKYAWRSLPNIIPHYMQNDLRFYKGIGINGMSVYAEPGDWFTYGLNHYVLGQLAWETEVNVDNLIKEYCFQLYGPQATLAAQVYSTLEKVVRFGCNIPHTKRKNPDEYEDYLEQIDSSRNEVTAAMGNKTDPALYRLKLMLDYAYQDIVLAKLKTMDGSEKRVSDQSEQIQEMLRKNSDLGVFIAKKKSGVL